MDLDIINRLYLELSQVATATTNRELKLEAALKGANEICRSMAAIADREGAETNWEAFRKQLAKQLKIQHAIQYPPKA